MNKFTTTCLAGLAFTFASPATASAVTLDFNGVSATDSWVDIGGFYNGGTSGDGSTGTDYGVEFTPNAFVVYDYHGVNAPNPGVLYFQAGDDVAINYAAGFGTFSFYYAASSNATITIYDGLNRTGSILATLDLSDNFVTGCGYCVWSETSVSLSGVAKSIDFAGSADLVAFDDMTFGSPATGSVAAAVPEPATWAMMIGGFGALGTSLRYRRRQSRVTYA